VKLKICFISTALFFDTGSEILKGEYHAYNYLVKKISGRMEKGEYRIFIAAGDGKQKLHHITHNLTYCYDALCKVTGSLVTFGFGFGAYDEHIIDAINRAAKRKPPNKLFSVYLSAFSLSKSLRKLNARCTFLTPRQ
jgi:hypothetical protein